MTDETKSPTPSQQAETVDALAAALEPFADQSAFWSDQVSDNTPLLEKDDLKVGDVRKAAKALRAYRGALSATPSQRAEVAE